MKQSINLDSLLKEYDGENTTEKIRDLKHSRKIRESVTKIVNLKKKYARLDKKNLRSIMENQCSFLYENYTNIFNKIVNDNLDLNLLHKFLVVLEGIETGKYDQHSASVKVGQLLKEIYIDSAVREANRKDLKHNKNQKKPTFKKAKKISWNEFKKMES